MSSRLIIALYILAAFFLIGCTADNVISEEGIKIQNSASEAVSGLLFENEMDDLASYNVRKDGHLVIKFHESVTEKTYTEIVNKLRNTPNITSVYAEQGGKEVCNLFGGPR